MATIRSIIRGLEILEKHTDPTKHLICAEHDQIWAGGDPSLYSENERTELEAIGWFVDDEAPSWSHFV